MSFWHNVWRFLVADGVSEQETRRLAGMLREGLAESETDAGFERAMRLLLERSTGLRTKREWQFLVQRLYAYRRAGEEAGHLRALAMRYLADVQRLYPNDTDEAARAED